MVSSPRMSLVVDGPRNRTPSRLVPTHTHQSRPEWEHRQSTSSRSVDATGTLGDRQPIGSNWSRPHWHQWVEIKRLNEGCLIGPRRVCGHRLALSGSYVGVKFGHEQNTEDLRTTSSVQCVDSGLCFTVCQWLVFKNLRVTISLTVLRFS